MRQRLVPFGANHDSVGSFPSPLIILTLAENLEKPRKGPLLKQAARIQRTALLHSFES